jgi:hypothetical protein
MTEKEWFDHQNHSCEVTAAREAIAFDEGVKAGMLAALAKIKDGLAKMVGL